MIDKTGNNEINAACADWLEAKKQLAKWKEIESTSKTKLINELNKAQDDELVCGDYEVSLTERKGSDGKMITLEDVGTVINKRTASYSIKINEIERR